MTDVGESHAHHHGPKKFGVEKNVVVMTITTVTVVVFACREKTTIAGSAVEPFPGPVLALHGRAKADLM